MKVSCVRVAANNSKCLRIATKTIFEKIRQFTLAVRNTATTSLQLFNDVRKHAQRRVDVFCLFHQITLKVAAKGKEKNVRNSPKARYSRAQERVAGKWLTLTMELAPLLLRRSLPAKSQMFNLPMRLMPPFVVHSKCNVNTMCDRELSALD